MDLGISRQIALVTGAGNGIGAACAHAFAREGCHVIVADHDGQAAQGVAHAIVQAAGQASALQMDVTDAQAVQTALAGLPTPAIDILVNNAGFSRDAAVDTMTDGQWSDVLSVNLTGAFHCIRAVVPGMKARGHGRIVNMASRAHFGDINKANYAAAKAGVIGLTKALSLELGPYGITVNTVAPGIVATQRLLALPQFPDIERRALATMPIQRIGQPAEVADAVLFLASANAGFITGETLHVSGGRYG